eukprot:TRINITY_DN7486_c0_g4_i2.p1 TRINITY_DN7486_c0_g4~~TRINITY_DN7486_c0_g4_i2.p1  ORF type:complete len:188 (+),score=19.33 TRINITY_DN7486_c0_g4_i2:177-740(+)
MQVEEKIEIPQPEQPEPPKTKTVVHPFSIFFHLFFRCAAIVIYVIGKIIFGNFILTFILTVLCLAFDFWTVKNVTGRILVGLRWWNKISDDGSSVWSFESIDDKTRINQWEAKYFWFGLLLPPIAWIAFSFLNLITFSLQWLVLCVIGSVLGCANIIGYVKCARDARQKVKDAAKDFIFKTAMERAF